MRQRTYRVNHAAAALTVRVRVYVYAYNDATENMCACKPEHSVPRRRHRSTRRCTPGTRYSRAGALADFEPGMGHVVLSEAFTCFTEAHIAMPPYT